MSLITLQSLVSPIKEEYMRFDKHYTSLFTCENKVVNNLLAHLIDSRGKMIRPILILLISKCYGLVPDEVYHLSSAVELLHQGSLIHDDVVDESDSRRGNPSANSLFGNKIAVLLGDFVVSRSLQEISLTDNLRSIECLSRLIEGLSEGEIIQLNALSSPVLSEELYFDIISRKTANLFETSAELSAFLSGASDEDVLLFRKFGHLAGLCFQVMDDILDYQDGAVTGKPAGNDLREGKFTLPSIHALNNSDSDWTDTIKDIRSLSATPEQIRKVSDYTVFNGGISYSESRMEELREEAMSFVPSSVPGDWKVCFSDYLEFITHRQK
jgi:octaprenyl-diphosphate synthase